LISVDKALRHRVNAARVAVSNQTGFFNELLGRVTSDWKADDTRVTFADFAISEKLFAELRRSFSTDQFFSEESGPLDEVVPVESRYAWILDPIDGTNNYALGMTSCAISLALLKEGNPVYGWIYDGSTGQLLEGGPHHGLLVDGRKLVVPPREIDRKSGIVGLHFPLPAERAGQLAPLLESYRIRSLGSAALQLAYVALGRLDGAIDERVRVWDIAAALCLLLATGREIHFPDGSPFPLETFDPRAPFIRYAAGNCAFIEMAENWLG
jgi:myo-inositol-1(or 4)-monophosphatase